MKKVILIALIIVVVVFGIGFALKACEEGNEPPTIETAKYVVTADNRYYYTSEYTQTADGITLHGFFDKIGGTWTYHKYDLKLSNRGYLKPPEVKPR
jgi:uncharacterized protein YxeA